MVAHPPIAGADPAPLKWTALHRAIAQGTLAQVSAALKAGEDTEARDACGRTALLLAVQTGDQHKVELVLLYGADRSARDDSGRPALFHARDAQDEAMFAFLLEQGVSPLDLDASGHSLLAHACECDNFASMRRLLEGEEPDDPTAHGSVMAVYRMLMGAPEPGEYRQQVNALADTDDPAIARALLQAGADPRHLAFEMRRALLGLPPEPDVNLLTATRDAFQRGAHPRFGTANPERMDEPFWHAMVASGVCGWRAAQKYRPRPEKGQPIWCAQRFGQSITFVPDGRIVQVAGEHEDSYDPDFCIYNDVFVHHPDGRLEIFGYPEDVFPPTDFHTATLVGDAIYLIGSLGYDTHRQPGVTPVFRLDTRSFRIERLQTNGDAPGRIFEHRALLTPRGEIRVFGGYIDTGKKHSTRTPNKAMFSLDLQQHRWTRISDR